MYLIKKNVVQFAINSKIKLIYRPAALKGNTPEAYAEKITVGERGDVGDGKK
ncbi:Putative fimbrial chaperone protein [Klebsiella pneumoniae IS53]|nr:Putative fimbrial chaperone protein [Klebsiella pneumoniae IS53]